MIVKYKKLSEDAIEPRRAHATDAGFDLVAVRREFDTDGNLVYGTGLAFEIPEGYAGLVFPRSSISRKGLSLTNAVGVIDSGYRGEVTAKFKPAAAFGPQLSPELAGARPGETYDCGERIVQLIILPYPQIEFVESEELSETDRGAGGYGSTGR